MNALNVTTENQRLPAIFFPVLFQFFEGSFRLFESDDSTVLKAVQKKEFCWLR
jgi:hypothetical protein